MSEGTRVSVGGPLLSAKGAREASARWPSVNPKMPESAILLGPVYDHIVVMTTVAACGAAAKLAPVLTANH